MFEIWFKLATNLPLLLVTLPLVVWGIVRFSTWLDKDS